MDQAFGLLTAALMLTALYVVRRSRPRSLVSDFPARERLLDKKAFPDLDIEPARVIVNLGFVALSAVALIAVMNLGMPTPVRYYLTWLLLGEAFAGALLILLLVLTAAYVLLQRFITCVCEDGEGCMICDAEHFKGDS
ncbi:MAG: hypothetical protein ACRCYU_23520 [Nocardioides sp.]